MKKFCIVINLEVPDEDSANKIAVCALEAAQAEDSAGIRDIFVEPGNKEPNIE